MPRPTPAASPADLLGMAEACALLGLSETTVKYHLSTGALRGVKPGRDWLFERGELERFAAIPRQRGPKKKPRPAEGE